MVGIVIFSLAMIATGFVAGFYAGYVKAVSDQARHGAKLRTDQTPKREPKP